MHNSTNICCVSLSLLLQNSPMHPRLRHKLRESHRYGFRQPETSSIVQRDHRSDQEYIVNAHPILPLLVHCFFSPVLQFSKKFARSCKRSYLCPLAFIFSWSWKPTFCFNVYFLPKVWQKSSLTDFSSQAHEQQILWHVFVTCFSGNHTSQTATGYSIRNWSFRAQLCYRSHLLSFSLFNSKLRYILPTNTVRPAPLWFAGLSVFSGYTKNILGSSINWLPDNLT